MRITLLLLPKLFCLWCVVSVHEAVRLKNPSHGILRSHQ